MKHLIATVVLALLAIHLNANEMKQIRISTDHTDLVLQVAPNGRLYQSYLGAKLLNEADLKDLAWSVHAASDGSVSQRGWEVYSGSGNEEFFEPALAVTHNDGNPSTWLYYVSSDTHPVEGGVQTDIVLRDDKYPVEVTLHYVAYPREDVIKTWTSIRHAEKKPVVLSAYASTMLYFCREAYYLTEFSSDWAKEAQMSTQPLFFGKKVIDTKLGSRAAMHTHPFFIVGLDQPAHERQGEVLMGTLGWTGNFRFTFEVDNVGNLRIIPSINPYASAYKLATDEVFTTPEFIFTLSTEGTGQGSRNLQAWARNYQLKDGKGARLTLLNNWENTGFNFNQDILADLMKEAKDLGVDMFLLDDGWFGNKYPRKDDHAGLGDWDVTHDKLPGGIRALTDAAREAGVKFGLWIEPEMVNPKSELFEKHPDWALQVKGRPLQYGRGGTQMLLDVCNPEVQDFMFGIVDNLLGKHPQIAYIKWDANVELKNYGSTYLPQDKQSHIYIEYHRGLNKVLERIRAKYPDVLIQACGGGGGRASYGVLPYFDEFWVSDNTDALQRIYMQWGTSYFYPSNAMAQHISASPNHQTGRIIPIKFRCDVAMSGRLGMELQPSKMTKEEYQQTAQAIKDYKSVRDVIQLGNLYRLVSPYDDKGIASLMYTDDTENKAVFFAYKMEHFNNQVIPRVCLRGLDPSKNYRVRELNVKTGGQPCFLNGKTFSGTLLMNTGIEMPLGSDYASCVLELTAE